MREILFKAKRIDNGEWVHWNVYGELCRESGKRARLSIKNGATTSYYDYIHQVYQMIDINTICQYTGLTDKNGNKIWENDVVKHRMITETVIFKDGSFGVYSNGSAVHLHVCHKNLEVIGNIFDNKDLIGE